MSHSNTINTASPDRPASLVSGNGMQQMYLPTSGKVMMYSQMIEEDEVDGQKMDLPHDESS